MPDLIYSTGTVSIAHGAQVVTGGGGPLWASNVMKFDTLVVDGFGPVSLLDVADDTHLSIAKWPYANVPAGTAYQILQTSPLRFSGSQTSAEVIRLTGALETDGFYIFVRSDQTVPDPSKGDEGQYARQPSSGKEWVKASGVWVFNGVFKALSKPAPYDNARVYGFMDVATLNGSSFVWINNTPGAGHAPPDATYWQILASKGDTGPTGPAAWSNTTSWATATNYVVGPPASVVVHPLNKNIYLCIVPHLSGAFAADLAAGKWLLIGQSATEATSGTALAIGIGSKVFSAVAGFSYQNGVRLRASSNGSPTSWMEGVCLYDPAAQIITMAVDKTGSAGTFADWNFNRCGQPGAGDLSSASNLSDLTNKPAALNTLSGVSYGAAQALTAAQQNQAWKNIGLPGVLRTHFSGLRLSTAGTAVLTVAAGVAADSTAADMMVLPAAINKSMGSNWSAGNNGGLLDTGSAANGFYHIYLIKNPTTQAVDVIASLGANGPTVLPGGYTLFRRVGSQWWGATYWSPILQRGQEFWWPGIATDVSVSNLAATQQTFALASIPPGVQVQAILTVVGWNTAYNTVWWVHDVAVNDTAPGYNSGGTSNEASSTTSGNMAEIRVWTDTARQVAARATTANTTLRIFTRGWFDPLGK